jgi:hypothetical protein
VTLMSAPNDTPHDALISDLARDLAPVTPLATPAWRAFVWIAAVAALALCGAWFADLPALGRRLSATPDMWLAVAGSTLTTLLSAFAAFQLSLPDRSRLWALLPLPAALLWIAASGFGCLRIALIPGTHAAEINEERDCLLIIIGLSVPLSVLLIAMLRKAYTLQPGLTALMAGLAAAAAAATLLNFFHPYDATASDLAVHAAAVAAVVAASRLFGARSLATENIRQPA